MRRKIPYKGKGEEARQLGEHGAVEINDVSNDFYTLFKWNEIIHKLRFLPPHPSVIFCFHSETNQGTGLIKHNQKLLFSLSLLPCPSSHKTTEQRWRWRGRMDEVCS